MPINCSSVTPASVAACALSRISESTGFMPPCSPGTCARILGGASPMTSDLTALPRRRGADAEAFQALVAEAAVRVEPFEQVPRVGEPRVAFRHLGGRHVGDLAPVRP